MEYIKENRDIVDNLIHILNNNNLIGATTYVLEILVLICNFWKEEGASMVYHSFRLFALETNSKIFREFVLFINDNNADTKKTAITLICLLMKFTYDKEKVT